MDATNAFVLDGSVTMVWGFGVHVSFCFFLSSFCAIWGGGSKGALGECLGVCRAFAPTPGLRRGRRLRLPYVFRG
jgi:hypothetical protein